VLRIRPFVHGDEETYVKVYNEGFSTEEWWGTIDKPATITEASNLDYDATFFAEVDGQDVGLVDIKNYGDEFHIENLVVLQKFRRKGIGTKLLNEAINFSKSKGIKRIRAEIPVQSASKFYEKNGFKLIKHAFLVEIHDRTYIEPHLNKKLFFEGDNKYWVPSEKEMRFLRKLGVTVKTIAKFKVMIKQL